MGNLKKLLIVPFFGDLPEWYDKFRPPRGYDMFIFPDIEDFKRRVREKLGIEYPAAEGSSKPWDYRACLGVLYEEEIMDYDFFGHIDFDCVFGDVDKWVTDDFLSKLDVHSNHHSYVNGCWSLYRNVPKVTNLFRSVPNWQEYLIHQDPNAWVEKEFSRALEQSSLRYAYTFWQGWPYTMTPNLVKENGCLYQDGEEIMMFHFRRSKIFPL